MSFCSTLRKKTLSSWNKSVPHRQQVTLSLCASCAQMFACFPSSPKRNQIPFVQSSSTSSEKKRTRYSLSISIKGPTRKKTTLWEERSWRIKSRGMSSTPKNARQRRAPDPSIITASFRWRKESATRQSTQTKNLGKVSKAKKRSSSDRNLINIYHNISLYSLVRLIWL